MKAAVRERYEKDVTVDEVIAEAVGIWSLFKKTFPKSQEHQQDALTEFYRETQREHPQFSQSYPVVMRYMCELGQFHPEALRKYLNYIRHHQWNSVDSYLESQAKYAMILYKTLNPRYKTDDAHRYYENVLRMLKQERKQFDEEAAAAKDAADKNHERMMLRNTIELREFYALHGREAVSVPIVVVSDEKSAPVVPLVAESTPDIDTDCF